MAEGLAAMTLRRPAGWSPSLNRHPRQVQQFIDCVQAGEVVLREVVQGYVKHAARAPSLGPDAPGVTSRKPQLLQGIGYFCRVSIGREAPDSHLSRNLPCQGIAVPFYGTIPGRGLRQVGLDRPVFLYRRRQESKAGAEGSHRGGATEALPNGRHVAGPIREGLHHYWRMSAQLLLGTTLRPRGRDMRGLGCPLGGRNTRPSCHGSIGGRGNGVRHRGVTWSGGLEVHVPGGVQVTRRAA